MHKPDIILHGYYFSSTSYRARILLNLKGLTYESRQIRLDQGQQHEQAFLALNPMGAVPVLEIDGLLLTQSPAIHDFIEERFPKPALLPAEQPQRQRVREITSLVACDMHPVNNLSVLKKLRADWQFNDADITQWYAHWIRRGFGALETLLKTTSDGGRFCVGDQVSTADVFLVPQVANARRFDIPLDDYPTIMAIDAHCQTIAAFEQAHPRHHAPEDKR
ncbi:MAG: maleylacetoacetate isomerase [Pseudomonadota bacterium]